MKWLNVLQAFKVLRQVVSTTSIEVWKSGIFNQQLIDICNKTSDGDQPNIWGKSGIVLLPKKYDLRDTGNYHGISLNGTAAKIYNKILLENKFS